MSNSIVGVLRAVLTADTASFDDSLKRSGDATKQWARTVKEQAESVGHQLAEGLGDSVLKMAAAFSAAHLAEEAVSGLIEFGKSAFTTSEHIVDLSKKLGISTDAIQQYGYVAQQGGTTVEAFGQSIFKLGVNVAAGGNKVEEALHDLGLSREQLRSMKPEEQFDLVARSLGSLTDVQQRNRDGVALMGKGYAEIAAAVVDYKEKVGQATIVDAERVKALDESAKAYERAKDSIEKGFTQAVGGIALGYENAKKAGLSFSEILLNITAGTLAQTVALKEQQIEQDKLNKMMAEYGKHGSNFGKDIDLAAPPMEDYTAQVTAAKAEIDKLTAAQKAQIASGLQLGEKIEDLGKRYGLSDEAIKIYSSHTAELTKEQAKHQAEAEKAAKAQQALLDAIEKTGRAISVGGVTDAIKKMSAELQAAAANGGLTKDSLEKYGKQIDEWLSQGYAVDSQMSQTHYDWILLHEATDTAAQSMKYVMTVSANLVPELERQGAAAKALAVNYGFFSAMASDPKNQHALLGQITTGPNLAPGMKAPPVTFGATIGASFAQQIPNLIGGALTGGKAGFGSAAAGIGTSMGGIVGNSVGASVTKSLTGTLTKSIGSAGGMVASVAGGMASMGISVGVQAAIAGVTHVIQTHQNATVKVREDFAKQLGFGDLPQLYSDLAKTSEAGQKLAETGQHVIGKQDTAANEKWMKDVQAFYADVAAKQKQITDDFGKLSGTLEAFGGTAPKSIRPMIDELMKAPGLTADMKAQLEGMEKDPSWQTLQSHAENLGISLSALGPAFQNAKITDTAQGYARDLQMFADAGADVPEVLRGMSDELSTLYQDAVKNKTALPDSLQPYMEQLVRMGLLVDENGVKVEDLGKTSFKKIEDKSLTDVVDVLKEIKDLLANQLPQAAGQGAAEIQDNFNKHKLTMPVQFQYENTDAPAPRFGQPSGGGGTPPPPQVGLQGGTHGQYVDWGSGTPVTLHGREKVTPEGEIVGTGSGAPIQITVVSTLDGKEIARNQVRYLPRTLQLAGL